MKGAGIGMAVGSGKHTQIITDSEIVSNAFIIPVASHETAANSLNLTATLLAMN
jgi:cytochrome P450